MAFASKTEQLKITCISFALEADRENNRNRTIEQIIEDANKFYQWIIGKSK